MNAPKVHPDSVPADQVRLDTLRGECCQSHGAELLAQQINRPPVAVLGIKPALYDYSGAGQELCLSRLSVRRLVEAGHIRTVRFGRAVRLRGDDINALIEAGGIDVDRLAQ